MKLQKYPERRYTYTCQFDFDIGYLVESPCRCCDQADELPHCSQTCHRLDRIRGILADTVPCTRRR